MSLENERLKNELHTLRIDQRKDQKMAENRAAIAEEKLKTLITKNEGMQDQKERLMHVHDVLIKYFRKHAKWKSLGVDPNELNRANPQKRHMMSRSKLGKKDSEKKKLIKLIKCDESEEENNEEEDKEEKNKEEKNKKNGNNGEMNEADSELERSIAAADAANRGMDQVEHQMNEWKMIHVAMEAMTESHMSALNEVETLSEIHEKQLNNLHAKIERLEQEKSQLQVAQGPGPTPTLQVVFGDDGGDDDDDGGGGGASGGSENQYEEEKNSIRVNRKKKCLLDGDEVGRSGKNNNSLSSPPSPPRQRRMSNYAKRKLEGSLTGYEGLAPIVVEILKRRPLPALDADATIIKQKKKISAVKPAPPSSKKNQRHGMGLRSKNTSMTYHRSVGQTAHNPHGHSPRQASRLHKPR